MNRKGSPTKQGLCPHCNRWWAVDIIGGLAYLYAHGPKRGGCLGSRTRVTELRDRVRGESDG